VNDATAARVEALEALLVEKRIVDPAVVDEVIDHYETNVGPLNGAKVIARAWTDPGYM
jgi:nitrile hydratase subunit alpha